jgi:hypothetical protein
MLERMLGAARLDVQTFEDVENDTNATSQAMLVVIIVSIASGIGALTTGGNFIVNFVVGIILGLAGWAIWAYITYFVGTKILNTPQTNADWGQLARVTAFAQAPGVLRVIGVIPFLSALMIFVTSIWILVAMVIAVRQALDYESTLRAIGVVVIGGVVYFILFGVVGALLYGIAGGALVD